MLSSFCYFTELQAGHEVQEKLEETQILEILAGGGKVCISCRESNTWNLDLRYLKSH